MGTVETDLARYQDKVDGHDRRERDFDTCAKDLVEEAKEGSLGDFLDRLESCALTNHGIDVPRQAALCHGELLELINDAAQIILIGESRLAGRF